MKRFNKTAIALATAGALTFAVAPSAFAQDEQPAPVVGENSHLNPVAEGTEGQPGTEGQTGAEENQPATEENAPVQGKVELKEGDVVKDAEGNVQAKYQPGFFIFDANGVNVTQLRTNKPIDGYESNVKPVEKDDEAAAIAAATALATLPLLTIGGIVYSVVKNAQGNPVLVPADRADKTPTAEDEAKTTEILAKHGNEIAAQAAENSAAQNNAATDRGVGAATGNNAIAKGLIGLVIASIMGAAVFMYGRRQLV
ncbi:hypothetical protein [Corynebacterium meitnerae]|uniref:Secreted protein n=1 Tax=Corynebacterium meitnerae TaxID=2913498 RepID=A0A9X3RKW6_9CORY|nr:hypothetical protein [Corynebacterium meitnerae]MCZ9294546.1 hypothetical protein [Corynebacterium meitnerae]